MPILGCLPRAAPVWRKVRPPVGFGTGELLLEIPNHLVGKLLIQSLAVPVVRPSMPIRPLPLMVWASTTVGRSLMLRAV